MEDDGLGKKKRYGDGGGDGACFPLGCFVKNWQENSEKDERSDGSPAPPTAKGVYGDRSEGLPNWEFLGSPCASGIESRDDRTQEVDAVGGIFDGSTEVLVAVDGVADEGPADGIEPEEGDGEKRRGETVGHVIEFLVKLSAGCKHHRPARFLEW